MIAPQPSGEGWECVDHVPGLLPVEKVDSKFPVREFGRRMWGKCRGFAGDAGKTGILPHTTSVIKTGSEVPVFMPASPQGEAFGPVPTAEGWGRLN